MSESLSSIRQRATELQKQYAKKRATIGEEERVDIARLQIDCGAVGHQFKFHPVAGEGQYCTVCGLVDYSVD